MTSLLKATCPPGLAPGQQFIAQTPTGQQVIATIPPKYPNPIPAGTEIWIRYTPVAAPMPIVMSSQADTTATSDEPHDIVEGKKSTNLAGAPKQEDFMPCAACCCSILSCYTKFPDCIGCYDKGTFVCCEMETLWCKTGNREESSDGSLCLCLSGEIEMIQPTTCCKLQIQYCCCNANMAMPCDEEVPCMITFLGITCVENYKCAFKACKTMDNPEMKRGSTNQEMARP